MPERPDYAALTRGQLAALDRINAGETGLTVLSYLVGLAQEVLGADGAEFTEYSPGHGRVIAASGARVRAIGRPLDRDDTPPPEGRTALVTLDLADDELGGGPRQMLGTRCDAAGTVVGTLQVYFDGRTDGPGPEQHAVLELLAALISRLYVLDRGLPVHSDARRATDQQARRQADRDLFVAVTSHELRTPVTVIKGYADTLTNHWDSLGEDGRHEAVRVIGARAGELARLVDRLLSATSEDGEVGGSEPGPFDLIESLRRSVDELPADLRRRLVLDALPAELPKAYGDRESLATILTELATNADKYSPPDTDVELTAEADPRTVTFRVCDRGAGVAPEHMERAFERYWQGESGDRRHHPGAGLGLYLVRRIVERQHGWVSLHARPGGGTVAEVRLPRA
jgi:signal transduction histidine kinase